MRRSPERSRLGHQGHRGRQWEAGRRRGGDGRRLSLLSASLGAGSMHDVPKRMLQALARDPETIDFALRRRERRHALMIMKENWKRSAVRVFVRLRERYTLRMGFLQFRHQALFNRSEPVLFGGSQEKDQQKGGMSMKSRSTRDGDSGAGARGLLKRAADGRIGASTHSAPSSVETTGRQHLQRWRTKRPPTTCLLYSSPPTTKYGKERFRAHRAHRLWHVAERQRKKYLRLAIRRWCNMANLKRAQIRAAA